MASLMLQFENGTSNAFDVGAIVTIGRLGDNTVVIDSPAVSSHHACIFRKGDDFIVEDLQSANGTFVNNARIVRQALKHGDVLKVGWHTLRFDQLATSEPAAGEGAVPAAVGGETVFLDPQEHQRLLAVVMSAEARAKAKETTDIPSKLGVLRVVAGRADQNEFVLKGHTSVIGRAKWTLVRLKGWFKPKVAVAITRNQQGYVANLLGGSMLVNQQPMRGRHDLKEGDVLEVGGLTLVFSLKEAGDLAA